MFELILSVKPQDLVDVAGLYTIRFLFKTLRSFFGDPGSGFIGSDSGFGWPAGTKTVYSDGRDS